MKNALLLLAITSSLTACTHDHHSHHETTNTADITNAIFTSSATNCAEYANEYRSPVKDINEDTS